MLSIPCDLHKHDMSSLQVLSKCFLTHKVSLDLMTSEVKDVLTAPDLVPKVVVAQPGISHDGEGGLTHSPLQWMPRAAELPPTTSSTDIHGTGDMTKQLLNGLWAKEPSSLF